MKLYEIINGYKLTPNTAANFSRKELATALRSKPYHVNLLLAGIDDDGKPSLYFMDYLALMVKEKFAAHGYGSFFILSTLDRYYKKGLSRDKAIDLLKTCIHEVQFSLKSTWITASFSMRLSICSLYFADCVRLL